jgi:SAM-dependent methyltransferase
MDEKTTELHLEFFQNLWERRREGSIGHSPEIWDGRADEWISEIEADPAHKLARAQDTFDFLKARGVLTSESDVVDVGCGPGLFVKEFAGTVKSALGLDYSKRFIEYAEGDARAAGIQNARYEYCDFINDDVSRYEGAFDLAFSSTTPATGRWESMKKFMRLSNTFCCNVSFVNMKDALADRICLEVFGDRFRSRFRGTGFYSLLNIVWLQGYYPETHYYDEVSDAVISSRTDAEYYASRCRPDDPDGTEKVLRWIEKNGEIRSHRETRYGLILWDIRRKDER